MKAEPDPQKMTASRLLALIKSQEELVAVLMEQIKAVRKTKLENWQLLAAKVKSGDSTGSELDDYLALHPNLLAEDFMPVAEYVKDLAAAVRWFQGEPVLIVHSRRQKMSGFMHRLSEEVFAPDSGYYFGHYYEMTFGILDFGDLVFGIKTRVARIYAREWLCIESGECKIKSAPGDNPYTNKAVILPSLDRLIMTKLSPGNDETWEVVVGWEAVSGWLTKCESVLIRKELNKWLIKHQKG